MARIDAYMRQGGSVLFDTRDQLERSTHRHRASAARRRPSGCGEMLASLDIPPLEPVPADHVLTKAFYLLNDFPGRYAGGPLWVEATQESRGPRRPSGPGRRRRLLDPDHRERFRRRLGDRRERRRSSTRPCPPIRLQREMAFRTGVNIVMYTLTGNYKADQVHVPALLERLGQ